MTGAIEPVAILTQGISINKSTALETIIEHKLADITTKGLSVNHYEISELGEKVIKNGGFEYWKNSNDLKTTLKENLEMDKLVGDVAKLKLDLEFAEGAKERARLSLYISIGSLLLAFIAIVLSILKK